MVLGDILGDKDMFRGRIVLDVFDETIFIEDILEDRDIFSGGTLLDGIDVLDGLKIVAISA